MNELPDHFVAEAACSVKQGGRCGVSHGLTQFLELLILKLCDIIF